MDRTESTVIQFTSGTTNESDKIREMGLFGWSLVNRQEAYERTGPNDVNLHFARSLNLPNLSKIQEIEKQYRDLPAPDFPKDSGCIGILLLVFFWPALPIWYFFFYRPKKKRAEEWLPVYTQKREELLAQVKPFLESN